MPGRELEFESHATPVIFRSPRNWTAIAFFGGLGGLHLSVAATAVLAYRWEAHMSLVFGTFFVAVATGCFLVRHEVIVLADRRRIQVRTGLRHIAYERIFAFSDVASVRVTLLGRDHAESAVAIVCAQEDIELPPTRTPRQEGLLLAMMMNVRLVKVYGDGPPPEPAQRIASLFRNEDAI